MTTRSSTAEDRRTTTYASGRSHRARRLHVLRADVFGALTVLLVVIAIALWVRGGGIEHNVGPGSVPSSLGRVTGLVASVLLLLQVLLMARIPWVERTWGQDVLARRHRLVGFASFHLMVAHIVLITIGYAEAGRAPVLAQTWTEVTTYPGMLLATAGTAALVVVVVTSVRAARRRLRYESWHLLHLYAYLGVGLALPHQLWAGTDFTRSQAATVFWWGLWACATLAVIACRIALPILRSLRHRIQVDEVIDEGPGVVSVVMSGRRLDRAGLRAGQFCQWRFLGGRGWTRAHPFSLSAMPTGDRLRITAKFLGDGSRALKDLRPGQRVLFEGPYGRMTPERRHRRDVLMVCAGIGITPMRALAEHILNEGASFDSGRLRRPAVTILHRVQAPADQTFAAEFAYLSRRADLTVVPLIGRRSEHSSIFPGPDEVDPQRRLPTLVSGLVSREVYLCGPRSFMHEARRHLVAAGVPEQQIHAEEFQW
ncbi:Predicted ferric reductase [Nakamurella panacisegetis]|uniref:Predicted ferric reductase n=1 Tax=Nakamurella panacisegetis TaxID=1090615 RepID=A0A1H0SAB2_9ACTN|nr:ferric reductase-like transmembrane domain-containing protein [Nakamurella panacisegetis]SDP38741.1 Predicted ferric reductase [Nakamurella panacisegetis]